MSVSILRNYVCWALAVLFPLSLSAADTGLSAMLHSKGGVWINGSESPESTAIFPGDSLETKSASVATLDVDGSSVLIQAESLLKFNGDSLTLEHGSVQVTTSKSMIVYVKCIKAIPVSNAWTQYRVTDLNGNVQVAAIKSDVNINKGNRSEKPSDDSASQSATVREGQQGERNESDACGAADLPKVPGHALNTKWIEIGAAAGGGGIALCLLLCKGPNPKNVSPSQP